tara:strand:- start:11 stop:835 length:825 start_codon:yes stop_codon:yes gene_type:complete
MKNSSQSKGRYQKNAEKRYKLWKNNWEEYSNNVEEIIKIFNLKGESKFQTKEAPKYWAGDIDSNPKFFIISLNPGYPKGREKKISEGIKRDAISWNKYKENRKNWFTDKSSNFSKSQYWKKNYRLICGMNNELPEKDIDGEYILENVLNLNLFPYHSHKSEDFPSKFTVRQLEIILHHLVLLFDLIEEKKPRYCFFNGKVWETLLIKHKLTGVKFSDPDPYKTNSKGIPFSMYYGKKGRTRYVLFDKFMSNTHYYGVNDEDFGVGIPDFINDHS